MKTWICAFFFFLFIAPTAYAAGDCNSTPVKVQNEFLKSGAESVIQLVCKIHTEAYKAVKTMEQAANSPKSQGDTASVMRGLVVTAFGYITMLIIAYGMIVLTFQVVELVVRLGIYGAFAPLFIYAYIYPSTRPLFDTAVKGFIYTVFKFALLGLFGGVSLIIIRIAMKSAEGFSDQISSGDLSASSIAQAVAYAAAAIASALMISRMMSAASSVAAALTQYSYANIGVAAGGASGISTLNRVTMMTALPVAGVALGTVTGTAMRTLMTTFGAMNMAQKGAFIAGAVAAMKKDSFFSGGTDGVIKQLQQQASGNGDSVSEPKQALPEEQRAMSHKERLDSYR